MIINSENRAFLGRLLGALVTHVYISTDARLFQKDKWTKFKTGKDIKFPLVFENLRNGLSGSSSNDVLLLYSILWCTNQSSMNPDC